MKTTLVLPSQFFNETKEPCKTLETALSYDCFDRCELTYKNSLGSIVTNTKFDNSLKRCVDLVKSRGLDISLAISIHQNNYNSDSSICSYQATRTGRKKVIDRLCPTNLTNLEKSSSEIHDAINSFDLECSDRIVLSYFRYENFGQCVCIKCINEFSLHMKELIKFEFNNLKDILSDSVICHWIDWKKIKINEAVSKLSKASNNRCIVEVDFDETKRYLDGVFIEEGIDIFSISKFVREFYLHIEPCKSSTDFITDLRNNQTQSYINHLKYIKSILKKDSIELTFFYWFLSKKEQINANLNRYLDLANIADADGVALLTPDPITLANHLSNRYMRHG